MKTIQIIGGTVMLCIAVMLKPHEWTDLIIIVGGISFIVSGHKSK